MLLSQRLHPAQQSRCGSRRGTLGAKRNDGQDGKLGSGAGAKPPPTRVLQRLPIPVRDKLSLWHKCICIVLYTSTKHRTAPNVIQHASLLAAGCWLLLRCSVLSSPLSELPALRCSLSLLLDAEAADGAAQEVVVRKPLVYAVCVEPMAARHLGVEGVAIRRAVRRAVLRRAVRRAVGRAVRRGGVAHGGGVAPHATAPVAPVGCGCTAKVKGRAVRDSRFRERRAEVREVEGGVEGQHAECRLQKREARSAAGW